MVNTLMPQSGSWTIPTEPADWSIPMPEPDYHPDDEGPMPAPQTASKKVLALPELPVQALSPKRRVYQPTFRQRYLSSDDVWLRLGNTAIYIGPELYYVEEVYVGKGDDYIFVVSDPDSQRFRISYNETPLLDLRSPEPRFFQMTGNAWYFTRAPLRQQKQGVCPNNAFVARTGCRDRTKLYNIRSFMRGARQQDDILWTNNREALLKEGVCETMRLSNQLAVYSTDQKSLHTFYKGRYLGPLVNDEIGVDYDDYNAMWLRRDAELVGLKLKELDHAADPKYFDR